MVKVWPALGPVRLRKERRRSRFSARGRWFSSAVEGSTQAEDGVFGNEAGDVVDVAVGVVAGAAAVQPEGLVDAE